MKTVLDLEGFGDSWSTSDELPDIVVDSIGRLPLDVLQFTRLRELPEPMHVFNRGSLLEVW